MDFVLGMFLLALGVILLWLSKKNLPRLKGGRWPRKVLRGTLTLAIAFVVTQCIWIGTYAILVGLGAV